MSNKNSNDKLVESAESKNSIVCKEMCFFCFDVLSCYLNRSSPPKSPTFTNEAFPIFVTWRGGSEKKLRGCIGTFSPLNLHDGLRDYALRSATKDNRFQPIDKGELSDLDVYVSILTNFEEADNYLDWKIGVHGIRIKFRCHGHHEPTSATYLPEVASEQGWNHLETIDSLLRKGGFRGQITQDVRESIELTRYQSEKLSATYEEYLAWKNRS